MTPSLPAAVRKRNLWLSAFVALSGLSLVTLNMFVNRLAYLSQKPYLLLAVAVAAVIGAYLSWDPTRAAFTTVKSLKSGGEPSEAGGVPPQMLVDPRLAKLANGNPQVMRLLSIVSGYSETLLPVPEEFEVEDGDLVSYGFRSTRPGELGTDASHDRLWAVLQKSLGDGWEPKFDATADSMSASRKSDIPSLVNPPIWPVVRDKAQAAAEYDASEMHPGVGADGVISVRLKRFVHWFLPGGTGGGKSVLTRALIEERRAKGHRFYILDGKGTDYTPFVQSANVSIISTSPAEHVLLIHHVAEVMRKRAAYARRMSLTGDTSWRQRLTPITFVVDEWAVARNSLLGKYEKELKKVDRDMEDILKLGREFRLHCIFSSQGTEAKTVPTDWLNQMRVVVALGEPSRMTINKAFPEDARAEVTRVGQQISGDTPGRAMVALSDDDGRVRPFLFQSYYSYSPGDGLDAAFTPEMRANFEQFKREVSDAIPRLYPREWFQLEYPAPDGKKDPYEDHRDSGWVDLSLLSVDDLFKLKPVSLEDPKTLEPIVDNSVYDPLNFAGYVGEPPAAEGDADISIEDL